MFKLSDRVKETSTTTGGGSILLAGTYGACTNIIVLKYIVIYRGEL